MQEKIYIVGGVSSSGKSTFINEHLIPKLKKEQVDIESEVDIKFAGRLYDSFDLGMKKIVIIHYNSLLKFDRYPDTKKLDLLEEKVFSKLLSLDAPISVHICYTPDQELLERINNRKTIEPDLSPSAGIYPKEKILRNKEKVDQRRLVLDFSSHFKKITNQIEIVFSVNGKSSILSSDEFQYGIPTKRLQNALQSV